MSINKRCIHRLTIDYKALLKNPPHGIRAAPLEENILEWHYVIEGSKDSPYEGGWYHGKILFPKEYPMKPPSILMLTPSGRFEPGRRLCLSMSDFHPETWNPMWSPTTILLGLVSFMTENEITYGSISNTTAQRRAFAEASLSFNVRDANFKKLFPELVTLHEKLVSEGKINKNAVKETNRLSHNYAEWFVIATLVAIVGVMAVYFGDIAAQLSSLVSQILNI